MPLVLKHSREAIRKAIHAEPEWMWQQRLTAEFLRAWQKGFVTSVERLQSATTFKHLEKAIREGNVGVVEQAIDFREAFEDPLLAEWAPLLEEVARRSGAVAMAKIKAGLKFDLDNPYTLPWLKAHAAELVKEISEETKLALRHLIADAYERNYTVDRIARRIRNMVGLTEREAVAVENYWAKIAADGTLTDKQVDRLTDKYSKKLLNWRAERIARHETNAASNRALMDSWRIARDEGYIAPDAVRVWTAAPESPRTCEICLSLDGKEATLDGTFTSQYGEFEGPPAHVACRCSMSIRHPGPKG